jgi:D-alanyl-D-alanine carboxypeptidase
LIAFALAPLLALAAPYAALVMDARTGEVLYARNADTRLHPASLTKMMTLYIAFEAIEHGEISLDTLVTVSANAAAEPPSKLGLRKGQKIALRYLIRAAAVKSANDAATAIGEAISGSESAFAERMNRTAKALGMTNSTFKNANGLTASGHLSTARDMTILGRRVFYDYPEYYNLFSRRTADANVAKVSNTNTRFLDSYEGADGIKTGYTGPAGFNLTASALRGNKRIIATVLGGTSTNQRNAKMAELLDLGFAKAPNRVQESHPARPVYLAETGPLPQNSGGAGKTVRLSGAVQTSPRPQPRPATTPAAETLLAAAPLPEPVATEAEILAALALAKPPAPAFVPSAPPQPETLALVEAPVPQATPQAEAVLLAERLPETEPAPQGAVAALPEAAALPEMVAEARPEPGPAAADPAPASPLALASSPLPEPSPWRSPAPATTAFAQSAPPQPETVQLVPTGAAPVPAETSAPRFLPSAAPQPETLALATDGGVPAPSAWPESMILASLAPPAPAPLAEPEVVARLSSSGGQLWGISLGKFNTSYQAERLLLQTALMETDTLGEALRKVNLRRGAYEANFVGMTRELAELACRRLTAREAACTVIGP